MIITHVDQIPITVISLRKTRERMAACSKRLEEQGVKFTFYEGVDGNTKGLRSIHKYTHDDPQGWELTGKQVGLWLSHYGLWCAWQMALDSGMSNAPAVMICEDDADFDANWKERINAALVSIPYDWELLFPGSSDCGDTIKNPPAGADVYRAVPLSTHCYIVKAEALSKLIDAQDRVEAPLDLQLFFKLFPSTYTYAILPRCVHQRGTHLNP